MEVLAPILGTFLGFFIYRLFTGYNHDLIASPEEKRNRIDDTFIKYSLKENSADHTYNFHIKDMTPSKRKDYFLADIAIKLSKENFHELAAEAYNSIEEPMIKMGCTVKCEFKEETMEIILKDKTK